MNSRDELSRGIVAYGPGPVEGDDNGARKEYANPDFWEKRFEGTEGLLTLLKFIFKKRDVLQVQDIFW